MATDNTRIVAWVASLALLTLVIHGYLNTPQRGYTHGITSLPSGTGGGGSGSEWASALVTEMQAVRFELKRLQQKIHSAGNHSSDHLDDGPAHIEVLKGQQAHFESEIAKLSETIAGLTSLSALGTRQDTLDSEVKQVAEAITKLTADVGEKHGALSKSVEALSKSFEALQKALEKNAVPTGTGELHHWHPGLQEKHSSKIAVIIESRPVGRLIRVVKQFMSVISPDWEFQIWFSTMNEKFLRDSPDIQQMMRAGRLRMYPMGREVFDIPWYNRLMMQNLTFWEFVGRGTGPDTKILIFQVDAVACAASPKKIEDFLQYDYVGAPWASPWYGDAGGNGGLCLRGREAMMECVRAYRGYNANEDGYFTECVAHAEERGQRKIAHKADAMTFSVETVYYEKPWGVHNAWVYLKPEETEALQKYCPEMEDARRPLNP